MSLIPAVIGCLSIAVMFFFYDLDDAKVRKIETELALRRGD